MMCAYVCVSLFGGVGEIIERVDLENFRNNCDNCAVNVAHVFNMLYF